MVSNKKLDIGSGRSKYLDYITLDNDPSVKADICVDFENLEFGIMGVCSYREARAHHILEHFRPENKVKVMALCWELLEVGGILDIEIPLFPHPASVQDPTHLSFWTAESFKYFIKGDPFKEAFAKRYSQYPVPLFEKVEDWYRGDIKPHWAYGIKLKKI